ncbi:MAG: HAD hydrolase family protein, partial [Leptolyngbya sp. SIO1D8]|nr:HAD hydrolase family protein [Leptolyngbya sp. SIO1D8]
MTDIRLLVLDIDGTIAGRSNQVTTGVKQAIAAVQARGIQVAIATGRMYQAAVRFHAAVGSTLPLLSYQGALIKDPMSGKVYRHTPLARNHTLTLLETLASLEAQQKVSIHLYIDDQLHVRAILPETQDYAERSGVEPIAVGDLASFLTGQPAIETTKLLALSSEPAVVTDLLMRLQQAYSP